MEHYQITLNFPSKEAKDQFIEWFVDGNGGEKLIEQSEISAEVRDEKAIVNYAHRDDAFIFYEAPLH